MGARRDAVHVECRWALVVAAAMVAASCTGHAAHRSATGTTAPTAHCPQSEPAPGQLSVDTPAIETVVCVYRSSGDTRPHEKVMSGDPLRLAIKSLAPLPRSRTCNANFDTREVSLIRVSAEGRRQITDINLSGCMTARSDTRDHLVFARQYFQQISEAAATAWQQRPRA